MIISAKTIANITEAFDDKFFMRRFTVFALLDEIPGAVTSTCL